MSRNVCFHENMFPFTNKNGKFIASSSPHNICTSPHFFLFFFLLPFSTVSCPSGKYVVSPTYPTRSSSDTYATDPYSDSATFPFPYVIATKAFDMLLQLILLLFPLNHMLIPTMFRP